MDAENGSNLMAKEEYEDYMVFHDVVYNNIRDNIHLVSTTSWRDWNAHFIYLHAQVFAERKLY